MKILFDTNILIDLEDNKIISEEFSRFYRLAKSNQYKVLYHPKALPKDIGRDKDVNRREIIKSKLLKYEQLEDFTEPSQAFISKFKNDKINDKIDNIQLYQLYKEYVDFFVTQDKGIHKNAKKIELEDKVLDINQILTLLEEKFTISIPSHPILKEHSIRELETKFDTAFFDSLRDDYGSQTFNTWLKKCARQNRRCYSLVANTALQAILIYNIETVSEHQIPTIYTKMLKICTFKVEETAFGIKLGELFLNKMFEYCINQEIKYLYLTVYEKRTFLIKLLTTFGFYRQTFTNSQGTKEIRMIKCLDKQQIKNNTNHIKYHPFYHDKDYITKYVIPIRPQFYTTLFKDGGLREASLFDTSFNSINEIQGNSIIKAYISSAKIKKLKKGDLLFFYSSKKNQVIEPIAILEEAQIVTNFEQLWNLVKKKTVFSQKELAQQLEDKKQLHVIIFRLITYMKKPIPLKEIQKVDSFKNKLQTITRLKEVDYLKLKNENYFNQCYIID